MIDFSTFFIAVEKTGGLFDFDGTLPLIALQVLGLMFFLNAVLYTPLLGILEERVKYIETRVSKASKILNQANQLFLEYENKLAAARKKSQREVSSKQRLYKELFENRIKFSQLTIDKTIDTQINDYQSQCNKAISLLLKTGLEELVYQIVKKIYTTQPTNIKILHQIFENPEVLKSNQLSEINRQKTIELAINKYEPQLQAQQTKEYVEWWPNEENKK